MNQPFIIQDEDIVSEAMCMTHVSHALDMMFEEDYNIVSFGLFPEANQMQPEEVSLLEL